MIAGDDGVLMVGVGCVGSTLLMPGAEAVSAIESEESESEGQKPQESVALSESEADDDEDAGGQGGHVAAVI